MVRKLARKEPLPRITKLSPKEQIEVEDANVRTSFAFAAKSGLLTKT
jgi:hypothetical protein